MMESSSPAAVMTRIGQVAINAHDVDRATAFYRDVLQLPFLFAFPGLAFFQCGATRLMISRPERPEYDHPASVLYYYVDDIGRSAEGLRNRGVRFEAEPHLLARMPDHELWI